MGDTESKVDIFYNLARLLVIVLGHQTSHKTFYLQSFLHARCAGVMIAQNL